MPSTDNDCPYAPFLILLSDVGELFQKGLVQAHVSHMGITTATNASVVLLHWSLPSLDPIVWGQIGWDHVDRGFLDRAFDAQGIADWSPFV